MKKPQETVASAAKVSIAKPQAQDKPIVTPTTAPVTGEHGAGGVIPSGAPTAPAVPGTVPLPADQLTAPEQPIHPLAGTTTSTSAAAITASTTTQPTTAPSLVPDHPTVEELSAGEEGAVRTDVVMERVPGTVPLPADQMTPVAPREVSGTARFLKAAGAFARGRAEEPDDRRLFPVAYDVDHDGKSYGPGEHVALTRAEHEQMFRATAVTQHWHDGLDPDDLDVWRR